MEAAPRPLALTDVCALMEPQFQDVPAAALRDTRLVGLGQCKVPPTVERWAGVVGCGLAGI